jgi:hypothetical protein
MVRLMDAPERNGWRCQRCKNAFASEVPRHAWVSKVRFGEPEGWTYICDGCRQSGNGSEPPRWDMYRCLDCDATVSLDPYGEEAQTLRHSPDVRIALRSSVACYVQPCHSCAARRADALELRHALASQPRQVGMEMLRVYALADGYRTERRDSGEPVYGEVEAAARAVEVEMNVDDAAAHPEFMRWLHRATEALEEAA